MSKKTLWLLLAASILLMIASAFNIGLFRALIGIPFFLAAIGCIRALGLMNPWRAYVPVIVIAVLASVFNFWMLGGQAWLFPILQEDAYVEVMHDTYCYQGHTSLLTCYETEKDAKGLMDMLSKNATSVSRDPGVIRKVYAGERYKIVRIVLGEGDFSSSILLRTDQGFDVESSDYNQVYASIAGSRPDFNPSKPIVSYFLARINTSFTAVIPTISVLLKGDSL
jgi:hypothetical protein